jgi:hypothetical protein
MSSRDQPRRRSGAFWVFWVAVAAAACAAVAVTTGQHQADPKGTLAAIFGILALFFVAFFVSRAREVRVGKAADLKGAQRGERLQVDDPTTLSSAELYGAMAIRPLDDAALKARAKVWDTERTGMSSGIVIVILIFLCVTPIYFFHTFVPTLIGAAVIGTWGVWKSFQLMGPSMGGVYEMTDRVMAPLGLRVTEHYDITIEPNLARAGGLAPATRGALVMEGERHGRHVKIRTPATNGGRSTRTVELGTTSAATFELRCRDGLFHAVGDAPAPVGELIRALPRSAGWKGVKVIGKGDLITVKRKPAAASDPMLDLWLGERLADALAPSPA